MAGFIYAKHTGELDPVIGKFEAPIKAIIDEESDRYLKDKQIVDMIFNVEKSDHFAESILGNTGFDEFEATYEGQGAPNDSLGITKPKIITHVPYMKEFTVTHEMMADSKNALAATAKRNAREFVKAYYKTKNNLAIRALVGGTGTSIVSNKTTIDTTTADGLSLFNKSHLYNGVSKKIAGTQSNLFYAGASAIDLTNAEGLLEKASVAMRNFKGDSGDVLGYTPNTIVIPGNRGVMEHSLKKVLGSMYQASSDKNAISTQYGNWNLVVVPEWQATDDSMILLSTDANEALQGNMFYDREKLNIKNWVDNHTRNYIWNGYCRFGIGFGNWRQVAMINTNSSNTAL